MSNIIERSFNDFYRQKIKINDVKVPRTIFFQDKLKNKTVIHYGCADWPVHNLSTNLHYALSKTIDSIDGYDTNKQTVDMMIDSGVFKENTLFSEVPNKKYDFLLIPETIEHVNNVSLFLHSIIQNIHSSSEILITAPNAFVESQINSNIEDNDYYFESVHPDHNYWFSIYTLPNIIQKSFNELNIKTIFKEIGFLEKKTMVYTLFTLDVENL
jgi:2-polyprenyl-3-methyl-5-hydroxy-6-metoxy-1,4-benzoquinol methylase